MGRIFPKPGREASVAAVITAGRRGGAWAKIRCGAWIWSSANRPNGEPLPRGAQLGKLAETLAAAGHSHRLRILNALANGHADHQRLNQVTCLAPGPLYYHLRELQLSGLVQRSNRNVYELTRKGTTVTQTVLALWSLLKQQR